MRRVKLAITVSLVTAWWNGAPAQDWCGFELKACESKAERRWDTCSAACDDLSSDAAWERCVDRCDEQDADNFAQCEIEHEDCLANADEDPGSANSADSELFGSRRQGKDGCYFGECPDGTGTSRQREPQPEPPVFDDDQRFPRDSTPYPQPAQLTSICQTPSFWCPMNVVGPVGVPCYCANPFGFPPTVNGITVPQR
jgi:hypothetical protein